MGWVYIVNVMRDKEERKGGKERKGEKEGERVKERKKERGRWTL
jgi:hypothetical protein